MTGDQLHIRREPNDKALTELLGIKYLSVHYNKLDSGGDAIMRPTDVVVVIGERHPGLALLDEEYDKYLKEWAARKTGVPVESVTVEIA